MRSDRELIGTGPRGNESASCFEWRPRGCLLGLVVTSLPKVPI